MMNNYHLYGEKTCFVIIIIENEIIFQPIQVGTGKDCNSPSFILVTIEDDIEVRYHSAEGLVLMCLYFT